MDKMAHRAYLYGRETVTLPLLQRDFSLRYADAKRALAAYIEEGWVDPAVSGITYRLNRQLLTPRRLSESESRALARTLCDDEDTLLGELCRREDGGLSMDKVRPVMLAQLVEKGLAHVFCDRCYLSVQRDDVRTLRVHYAESETEGKHKEDIGIRGIAHPILVSLLKEDEDGEMLLALGFLPESWKRYIREGLARYRGLPGLYPRLGDCPMMTEEDCKTALLEAFLRACKYRSKGAYSGAAARNASVIRNSRHCPTVLQRAADAVASQIRFDLSLEQLEEMRSVLLSEPKEPDDGWLSDWNLDDD